MSNTNSTRDVVRLAHISTRSNNQIRNYVLRAIVCNADVASCFDPKTASYKVVDVIGDIQFVDESGLLDESGLFKEGDVVEARVVYKERTVRRESVSGVPFMVANETTHGIMEGRFRVAVLRVDPGKTEEDSGTFVMRLTKAEE